MITGDESEAAAYSAQLTDIPRLFNSYNPMHAGAIFPGTDIDRYIIFHSFEGHQYAYMANEVSDLLVNPRIPKLIKRGIIDVIPYASDVQKGFLAEALSTQAIHAIGQQNLSLALCIRRWQADAPACIAMPKTAKPPLGYWVYRLELGMQRLLGNRDGNNVNAHGQATVAPGKLRVFPPSDERGR